MDTATDSPQNTDFKSQLKAYQAQVEEAIDRLLPPTETRPAVLHQAMHYSMKAGGKRLRPILLLASHHLFPSDYDPMPAAVALECLHTYSLIHDDLPCMDNSDLRRGNPTCHKQFDEETALLAGDALLTYAFWLIAEKYSDHPEIVTALLRDFGSAAGSEKLIGGQMEDLLGEKETPTAERLEFIHRNKTAALLITSLTMGIRLSTANQTQITTMQQAGHHLGLAFQIIDDILDATADSETLGKPAGADAELGKMTYPAFYGLEESRRKAREHTQKATELCKEIGGNGTFLLQLIDHMEKRVN